MDTNSYITWSADPVIFTIPEITLPFTISIWGLLIAAVLIYFGWGKIKPEQKKGKKQVEPETWKVLALGIGAFIIGQIPFLLVESTGIETIGPIEPRWYGLMFAFAFISGYLVLTKAFNDAGRSQQDLDRLFIYILVATIVGARLGHVFFYEAEFYLRNIHLIPQVWIGGLASHGAAIGILIALYFYAKKTANTTFMWVADRVVIGVAIGAMFIRVGNFFNSEILGVPTDLPWAIVFEVAPSLTAAEQMMPRHPSMLYEALIYVILFAILVSFYYKYDKKPPQGSLFGIFLVILFSGRFMVEFTKETLASFMEGFMFDMGQLLSVPFVLIGIWILWKKVDWKSSRESES
ncbi:MAG: prolipoprotein diacylglyceryl transferase [Balneolaceae bacterium]|nr:MAG: prolipoprotein diacylglyceryl transferase [Balneolaceae bacterium]